VFEKRVKLNCFYCNKYNTSWTCPPKIPDLDYKEMFNEFENYCVVYGEFPFVEETYSKVRAESSVIVHKAILEAESYLLQNGNSTYLSFIGGSCKLCKNGCGVNKCNNPYLSRIPLEATGVNVIKTLAKYGIEIKFPVKDKIIRAGLLLW
jgi:predicted metal-binding protein